MWQELFCCFLCCLLILFSEKYPHWLQNDDLKLHEDQSDYWTTFLSPADTMIKYGWRNSRILRATLQGHGKLTASLTYISGPQQTTEVELLLYLFFPTIFVFRKQDLAFVFLYCGCAFFYRF